MADVPMYYMSQGEFLQALQWVLNQYIGYGIIWLLIGIAIYATTHEKSRSAAISGLLIAMFLALAGGVLPVEAQAYFAIIAGVSLFMVIYKVVR